MILAIALFALVAQMYVLFEFAIPHGMWFTSMWFLVMATTIAISYNVLMEKE